MWQKWHLQVDYCQLKVSKVISSGLEFDKCFQLLEMVFWEVTDKDVGRVACLGINEHFELYLCFFTREVLDFKEPASIDVELDVTVVGLSGHVMMLSVTALV